MSVVIFCRLGRLLRLHPVSDLSKTSPFAYSSSWLSCNKFHHLTRLIDWLCAILLFISNLASLLHILLLRGTRTTHGHRHGWNEWVLAGRHLLRVLWLLLIVIVAILLLLHAVGKHKWLQVILVGHAANVATGLSRGGLKDVVTRRSSILLLDLSRRGSCIDLVCVLHSLVLASASSDSLKFLDLEDATTVCWTNIFSGPFAVLFELFVHVE